LCAFFFLIVFPGIHSMFYRKKIMTSFLRMWCPSLEVGIEFSEPHWHYYGQ
jgi:hypothetical protein